MNFSGSQQGWGLFPGKALPELSEPQIRRALPRDTQFKIFDEKGLHLLVRPTGTKTWRLRQIVEGKERITTLGNWPGLSLESARDMRDGIRSGGGQVPFELIAKRWWEDRKPAWKDKTAEITWARLERVALPTLGSRPIGEIRASEVKAVIDGVRRRGRHDLARRVLQYLEQIFAVGCVELDLRFNPATEVARAPVSMPKVVHRKALPLDMLGGFLVKLDEHGCDSSTRLALKFLILTWARTGEVRMADWAEMERLSDPEQAVWRVPASRMKMGSEHIVPLSKQAIAILKQAAGDDGWPRKGLVFPGERGKPMSENTMLFTIYKLGYRGVATTHGMRSVASTWANEAQWNPDVIERALSHVPMSEVRRAYNAAKWLPERRKLLQEWGSEVASRKRVAEIL